MQELLKFRQEMEAIAEQQIDRLKIPSSRIERLDNPFLVMEVGAGGSLDVLKGKAPVQQGAAPGAPQYLKLPGKEKPLRMRTLDSRPGEVRPDMKMKSLAQLGPVMMMKDVGESLQAILEDAEKSVGMKLKMLRTRPELRHTPPEAHRGKKMLIWFTIGFSFLPAGTSVSQQEAKQLNMRIKKEQ